MNELIENASDWAGDVHGCEGLFGGGEDFSVPDKIRNLGGEGAIVLDVDPRPQQFDTRVLCR